MSFLSHVVDKHNDLDDLLYNKCQESGFFQAGLASQLSPCSEKFFSGICNLANTSKSFKQTLPLDWTNFLEGFNSFVNQLSSKVNAYYLYC